MANDLAWASGLFEGEGTFSLQRRVRPVTYPTSGWDYPVSRLTMSDQDSVRRFHEAVGVGKVYGPYDGTNGHKPLWRWEVNGFEKVQAVVAMLWHGLGRRRRARAKEVLSVPFFVKKSGAVRGIQN